LKNLFKIVILTLILTCCKEETEKKTVLKKSKFNLKTDLTNFKHTMTEADTIRIWFNHSVCTSQSFERIEITKKSDSLNIRSEFKDINFSQNSEWKIIYNGNISVSDTVWKIEKLLKENIHRQKSDEKAYGTLQISHNGDKVNYFTSGLRDLQKFIIEYNITMKELYPQTVDIYYNIPIPVLNEDMKTILETELEN